MSHFIILVVVILLPVLASGSNQTHHNVSTNTHARRGFYAKGAMVEYLVSIRTRHKIYAWGDNHFCSGALLTSRWVLTAAGCVTTRSGTIRRRTSRKNLKVVVYTPFRLKKPYEHNIIPVEKVVLSDVRNICCQDLVLIKLEYAARGNQNHVMKLPSRELSEDWLCFSLGWGRMYHNGPITNLLIRRVLRKVDSSQCARACGGPHLFCMTSYSGRNNIGQTDMGTPVFCGTTVYGVAGQYHSTRQRTNFVYASTYAHRDFILKVLATGSTLSRSLLSIVLAGLLCVLN